MLIRMLAAASLAPAILLADFSYTEITRVTGGALASMSRALGGLSKDMRKMTEPTVNTVLLKGNTLAHVNAKTAHIVDLDKETITDINFEKKTYSTITFAQMKEAMEKMAEKSKGKMEEAKAKQKSPEAQNAEMNMKMDIKDTGKVQNFSGIETHEVLMTITMEATDKKSGQSGAMDTMMSIWVADTVKGWDQLEEFNKKYAMKMASTFAASPFARQGMAMAQDPRFREAAEKMAKEAEKLKGVHIRQVTKMGMGLDPNKAGEVSDPNSIPEGPTAGQVAGSGAKSGAEGAALGRLGRSLPGGLGGLGGLGRRKKEQPQEQPQQQQQGQAQAQGSGVLMEMLVENSEFSTGAVDASKYAVPAGFEKVDNEMTKVR